MKVSSSLHTHTRPPNTTVFHIPCPVFGLLFLPHLSLLMLLESRLGMTQSLASIYFPKWKVEIVSKWPRLPYVTRELAEDWSHKTLKHSKEMDFEKGVNPFDGQLTALLPELTSDEARPFHKYRSTYEISAYLLLALKDILDRLLKPNMQYENPIKIEPGYCKSIKRVSRQSINFKFFLLRRQWIILFFGAMA